MPDTYQRNSRRKLIATILAVLVIASVIVLVDHLKAKNTAAPTTANATTSTMTTANSGTYKDGTYTATSDYQVPHGTENIVVNLTISGGAVSDISIQNSESDHDSAEYQEEFASAYKSAVVGKKISGLQISTVAGASDTTQGFNDALSQIATKAQA